jgi:UDP-2,3-diacylglucosamine hydrolase
MKYIVASDFHLKLNENFYDLNRRHWIEDYLRSLIGNTRGLILAGDIFDFWMEWDNLIIKTYYPILTIFEKLKKSGCRLVYIQGNHDFWVGEFLSEEIGFEIYDDYFVDTIHDKRVYISHGDKYASNDLRYHLIHDAVKLPCVKKLAKIIHPHCLLKLSEIVSRTDQYRSPCDSKLADLTQKAEILCKVFDLVVFGHTHKPEKHHFGASTYINTGDWINHRSFCTITKEKISLSKFAYIRS